MVAGFDNVHMRSNLPRLEEAYKYGSSAGDRFVFSFYEPNTPYDLKIRIYTGFALLHIITTKLFVSDHRMPCCFLFFLQLKPF